MSRVGTLSAVLFFISFELVLFELLLTRLFGVVLFAQFAHLALALALLGISVGAILQHLRPSLVPEEGLERRLAWLCLLQGLATLLAVVCTLEFPVTLQSGSAPTVYQERSSIQDELLDPYWFAALLPVLSVPFAIAGLAFAGVFQRRKQHIGQLYGADLIGGAAGAVAFIPLLGELAGPDTIFVITLSAAASAALLAWPERDRALMGAAGLMGLLSVGALVSSAVSGEVLEVKFAAGYSERNVTYVQWTPLTRLSIHKDDKRGDFMLLDNTSASEIFRSEARRAKVAEEINRALVFHLYEPPARVAILAASAGPEVAVAQSRGFTGIDAIDIAGEIFDIVAEQYPDSPVNPYTHGDTHRVKSDGRAAILHAQEPYDIIQMVHANLWSSAGLLANAWSPSLLETKEAFETYFDHLSPRGMISFGRGASTDAILRSAVAALRARGITEPLRHIAYVKGTAVVLLVKKEPFSEEDRARLLTAMGEFRDARLLIDPGQPLDAEGKKLLQGAVMTDDRPYLDDPGFFWHELQRSIEAAEGDEKPLAAVYRSIVIQVLFTLVAGFVFIGLPLLSRRSGEARGMRYVGPGLLYIAGLGYGYLAVETVLVHELILFVGHPTYAVTAVILSMLLSSGLGSMAAGRLPEAGLARRLRAILAGVILLGLVQAFVVPKVLYGAALGLPGELRIAITVVALAPLGFLMGMPFPLALRLLRADAAGLVPWGWAINGWMSVVASLATVVISRMWGYSTAFGFGLAFYLLALLMVGFLGRIAPRAAAEADGRPAGGASAG